MRTARRARPLPWTQEDLAILQDAYANGGVDEAADALPERTPRAIYAMACRLKIRSPIVGHARTPELAGEQLERAVRRREVDGWSYARIAAEFGVSETSASNAVLMALCPRKGFTPVPRDHAGRILPEGIDRIREMLRKGMKAVDIQLQAGVSAACVAEQRRRYRADLKDRGMAPLPAPGNGARYSGARVPRSVYRQAEALFMEGLGTARISERVGLSKTQCLRLRAKLIRRLARKGQTLPGCDADGRRRRVVATAAAIPAGSIDEVRAYLLQRMPVARAARIAGVGTCIAYRIRDELDAELRAAGNRLLPPVRDRGRWAPLPPEEERWLPIGKRYLIRFRTLAREHGIDEGKRLMREELAAERRAALEAETAELKRRQAERRRPLTFEEQLARVAAGAKLTTRIVYARPGPDMTLGGVSTGAL